MKRPSNTPSNPNLEAVPAIPKLKHERETEAQAGRLVHTFLPLSMYLTATSSLVRLSLTNLATPKFPAPSSFSASYLSSISTQQRSRPRPPKNGELATPSKRNLPAEKSQATNPNTQSQVQANSNQTRRDRIENSLGRSPSAVAAGRESDEVTNRGRGFWSVGLGLGGQGTRGRR